MRFYPAIEAFLAQKKDERTDFAAAYAALADLLAAPREMS
jgi:flagellar biosynthesis/type III secretory pathway ATPase